MPAPPTAYCLPPTACSLSRREALGAIGAGLLGLPALAEARQGASNALPFQKSPITLPKNPVFPVVLSYSFWNGLIVVEGILNGAGSAERFVVDTGLNANAFSNALYAKYKLQASPRQVRVLTLDRTADATELLAQKLQLGAITLEKMEAALIDVFPLLSSKSRPDAPGAWLGTPFLFAFQFTLDMESRILALNDPKTPLSSEANAVQVPFTVKDGRMYVKATIPNAPLFTTLITTGTVGTLIPTAVAERLRLKPLSSHVMRRPNGKEGRVIRAIAPKLQVGKAEVTDLPVLFIAPDAPPEFDRTLGALGVDFLRRFKVTVSYTQKKLVLTIPTSPEATSATG